MANNINTNANINVGVRGQEQLNQLQSKLQQTSKAFGDLKAALGAIAVGSFITSLYKSAAALKDVSDASGIGVQQLLGFQKAVKQFGGDAEGALDGVSKLAQAIDGAAGGSKELQDRFLELGIGLNDLRTLSEAEILNKVVKSLGEGENNSAKMAAAIDLFGKKFKNVNFKDVAANIDEYTKAQQRAASATEAADRAEEAFGTAVGKFKSELLIALEPISKLASNLLEAGSAMKEIIRLTIEIGAVLLTFTLLGKLARGVSIAITGIKLAFTEVIGIVAKTGASLTSFGSILMALVKNIPLLGTIAVALGVMFGHVKDGIQELFPSLKKDSDARNENANAANKQGNAQRDVTDAYKKQKEAIKEIVDQFDKQNKKSSEQLRLETSLLGLSKEEADAKKAQFEVAQRYQETLDRLTEARANLSKEELKAGVGKKYDEEIARLGKLKEAAMAKAKADADANSAAQTADEVRKFAQQNEIDNFKQLQTIRDNIAKSTMSALDAKKYDLEISARARFQDKVASEEQRLNRRLTAQERQAYQNEAIKGLQELQVEAEKEYNQSRRFSTGWTQAFNEYADNATNAATQAKQIFQTMTQGMEDLLMNFFKKGEFGWKNFVQTIIDVMMRSQIQQLIAKTFGGVGSVGGGGRGGLLGGAIIPGFLASGGPAQQNKPYIVGERGPELFVPNTSGTVIPNDKLNSGSASGGTQVVYNINAVDAMSFKQMLARDPSFLYAVSEQGRRTLPGAA